MIDQFFTPEPLARRIVEWVKVRPGMRVLEPSAGAGVFVRLLREQGVRVCAVEQDHRLCEKLAAEFDGDRDVMVRRADFEQLRPPGEKGFDLVVMNPPYGSRKLGTAGMAVRHVALALEHAPRVVALAAASFEHTVEAFKLVFSKAFVSRRVALVGRPRFEGPDDKGETPKRDYAVLELYRRDAAIGRGPDPSVATERWLMNHRGAKE